MILKTAAFDYLYRFDLYKTELKEFFVSGFFVEIMQHFGTDPNDFLHELYYQKEYWLKTRGKKVFHVKIKEAVVVVKIRPPVTAP